MNRFRSPILIFFLKVYVAISLIIATILSPLALSFIPLLLLIWYCYLWRRPMTATINLLTAYFVFFALTLLFVSSVGPFLSWLISLPVLLLVHQRLEEAAESLTYHGATFGRRPTSLCLALLFIALAVLVLSLLLGNLALLFADVAIMVYFGVLGALIFRRLPLKPVEETQIQQRMVAGSRAHLNVKLTAKTKIGGQLFLESPYEWLTVSPARLSLKEDSLEIGVSLSPPLAGPSLIRLKGWALDRWGLIQTGFELEPIRLYVIPRARYAAWLVKRYLTETKRGTLPLISNIAALKPLYGLRRGIEYYGSQLYQPGDSLKSIDWKHSLKYNELITKEFAEFQGRSAIILINLAVANAEEADKLAYNIMVAALSLAQENIPAALAVYDHEEVRLTTSALPPQRLLLQSLQIARKIVTFVHPQKYLNPPDVTRLRANISRIQSAESGAAKTLVQLLRLEYENLADNAWLNPATKALTEVLTKVDKQSNIVIISQANHDAEAISFNIFNLTRKGNAVITV